MIQRIGQSYQIRLGTVLKSFPMVQRSNQERQNARFSGFLVVVLVLEIILLLLLLMLDTIFWMQFVQNEPGGLDFVKHEQKGKDDVVDGHAREPRQERNLPPIVDPHPQGNDTRGQGNAQQGQDGQPFQGQEELQTLVVTVIMIRRRRRRQGRLSHMPQPGVTTPHVGHKSPAQRHGRGQAVQKDGYRQEGADEFQRVRGAIIVGQPGVHHQVHEQKQQDLKAEDK
mmetsp:Transcript_20001/g.55190  ORF Transcript_20001/g.55190 Transcript_20001/m.55190 type:complete len:226 (+) Transcript_20001:2167-2844(+)